MFDSTTAKATLAIGDPDRTGTLLLSFLCLQLFPLNALPLSPQRSNFQTRQRVSAYPLSFQSLAHSFALFCIFLHSPKTQLFSFQSLPHSLQKTTRGGGRGELPNCRKISLGGGSLALGEKKGTGRNACPTNSKWACATRRAGLG